MCGPFSSSGVGSLHKINEIMKKVFDYFTNLFETRCQNTMFRPLMDFDVKHTTKIDSYKLSSKS